MEKCIGTLDGNRKIVNPFNVLIDRFREPRGVPPHL
jgi:hypothetical protein